MHKFLSQADEQLQKHSVEWLVYAAYTALLFGASRLFFYLGKTSAAGGEQRVERTVLLIIAFVFFGVNALFAALGWGRQRPGYLARLWIVSFIVYVLGLLAWIHTITIPLP